METIITLSSESEYNEILQQTVAVIEAARFQVARTIATSSNDMHWSIGKILHDRKLEGRHGDGIVKRLSADLKSTYPTMGLSVRNLWYMKRFYIRFKDAEQKRLSNKFRQPLLCVVQQLKK